MRERGRLTSVRNEVVVLTGFFDRTHKEFADRIRRAGGTFGSHVTSSTTILAQGSPHPAYQYESNGTRYGNKIAMVRDLSAEGAEIAVITGTELLDLIRSRPLSRRTTRAATERTDAASELGIPHRFGRRAGLATASSTFYDPADRDAATARHHRTVDQLAKAVEAAGYAPLDPVNASAAYDLAWRRGRTIWVVEVKTLTSDLAQHRRQVRYGLGQVLHYAAETTRAGHTGVQAAVVTDSPTPDPSLSRACDRANVVLTNANDLEALGL